MASIVMAPFDPQLEGKVVRVELVTLEKNSDCHDGSAGGNDGGRDAHNETFIGDSGASHRGGNDISKESLRDGACVGVDGGQLIMCGIAIVWGAWLSPALNEVCKASGKDGACFGGGGGPLVTATSPDIPLFGSWEGSSSIHIDA